MIELLEETAASAVILMDWHTDSSVLAMMQSDNCCLTGKFAEKGGKGV